MRIVIGLLALTAACSGDDGMLPVGGGGTDGGGLILPDASNTQRDAAIDGQGSGSGSGSGSSTDETIVGRVCLVSDPRNLNACATTGAGGFTVELGEAMATTAADGTFSIAKSGDLFKVSGTTIKTSYMPLSDFEIPVIPTSVYTQMETANLNVLPNPGEGALFVQVVNNGYGVTGATASTTPTGFWLPFYDSAGSVTVWNQTATVSEFDGSSVWVPGLDVGTVSVTVSYNGDDITTGDLPIYDGALTFTTTIFDQPPP